MRKDDKKYMFGMEIATLLGILAGAALTIFSVGVSYSVLVQKVEAQEAATENMRDRHSKDSEALRKEMKEIKLEIKSDLRAFRTDVKSDMREMARDIKQIIKNSK